MRTYAGILLLAVVLELFPVSRFALAADDDYVQDPSPILKVGREQGEPYEAPRDPEVCRIYLENLKYFARRGEPLSCGQPVAPMLRDRLQKVEWEDLRPEAFPNLFRDVVKGRARDQQLVPETLADLGERVQRGDEVFRRARLELRGSPMDWNSPTKSLGEIAFHIVQYGRVATGIDAPDSRLRCKPVRGRILPDQGQYPVDQLFIVDAKLSRVYDALSDWRNNDAMNLWLIKNYPYAERYFENGDVRLSELRLANPVHLEPVCLYHYKRESKAK